MPTDADPATLNVVIVVFIFLGLLTGGAVGYMIGLCRAMKIYREAMRRSMRA